MSHLKLPIFLLVVLCIVIVYTFSSSHPETVSYVIKGKISVELGSSESVPIYFKQDNNIPTNRKYGETYYTRTNADGTFLAQYRAPANSTIYLIVDKEGYFTITEKLETAETNELIKDVGEIIVAGHHGLADGASKRNLALPVFPDICDITNQRNIAQNDILYMSKLRYNQCTPSNLRLVSASVIMTDYTAEQYNFDPLKSVIEIDPSKDNYIRRTTDRH